MQPDPGAERGASTQRGHTTHSRLLWASPNPGDSSPRPPGPASLTVTPEMMGALPSMSRCTSCTASSPLLSLNLFLESSSRASLNCSNVMVRQPLPLQGETAEAPATYLHARSAALSTQD